MTTPDYEYATVRSDDAAKWIGRDGWEVAEQHAVQLRRLSQTGRGEMPEGRRAPEAAALLGKRVIIRLGEEEGAPVLVKGKFLCFGDGGDFVIQEDGGFLKFCWPMLEIKENTDDDD